MVLAISFDTESLKDLEGGLLLRAVTYVSEVPRIVVATVASVLLLGGAQLTDTLVARLTEAPSGRRVALALSGHIANLGIFIALTARVLERPESSVPSWALLATWLGFGLATVACLPFLVGTRRGLLEVLRDQLPLWGAATLVGVGAWAAGHVAEAVSGPLQSWTLRAVFAVLQVLRADATLDAPAFIVGTSAFQVEVAPECSGYEGIGLILVFLGVFIFTLRARFRFPHVLLLLPIGVALAWIANLARMVLLILVGGFSSEIARGGFHSYAGTLLFCGTALGLGFTARRSDFFAKPGAISERDGARSLLGAEEQALRRQVDAFVGPLTLLLATGLATGLLRVGELDWLYPVRVCVAGAALWFWRHSYRSLEWQPSWVAPAVGMGVAGLWLLLTPFSLEQSARLGDALGAAPRYAAVGWLLLRGLGASVLVPVIEELAFRGYLLRRLSSRDFTAIDLHRVGWLPVALSSVCFGVLHAELVAGTLAGVAYALVARHRGRLTDAMLAHGVTNLCLALYALGTERWDAWL